MSNEIAVIGEDRIISIFKAFGFLAIPLKRHDRAKLKDEIEKLVKEGFKIIFVQEDLLSGFDITKYPFYNQTPYPVIVGLPTHRETQDLAATILKATSIKAAGTEYIGTK